MQAGCGHLKAEKQLAVPDGAGANRSRSILFPSGLKRKQ
jgi:hypothetical protein